MAHSIHLPIIIRTEPLEQGVPAELATGQRSPGTMQWR